MTRVRPSWSCLRIILLFSVALCAWLSTVSACSAFIKGIWNLSLKKLGSIKLSNNPKPRRKRRRQLLRKHLLQPQPRKRQLQKRPKKPQLLLLLKPKRPSPRRRKLLRSLRRSSQNQWWRKRPQRRKWLRRIQSLLRQAPVRMTSPLTSKREEPKISRSKPRREQLLLGLKLRTHQRTMSQLLFKGSREIKLGRRNKLRRRDWAMKNKRRSWLLSRLKMKRSKKLRSKLLKRKRRSKKKLNKLLSKRKRKRKNNLRRLRRLLRRPLQLRLHHQRRSRRQLLKRRSRRKKPHRRKKIAIMKLNTDHLSRVMMKSFLQKTCNMFKNLTLSSKMITKRPRPSPQNSKERKHKLLKWLT